MFLFFVLNADIRNEFDWMPITINLHAFTSQQSALVKRNK